MGGKAVAKATQEERNVGAASGRLGGGCRSDAQLARIVEIRDLR